MTLKQIEYFQRVCAKGNISAAAEELFVSRSVISRAIAELEAEFETQVFLRSKNGIELTESGNILARLFETYTGSYSTAKERIRCLGEGKQSKSLRLGVTPTNAYCVYRTYLEEFMALRPEIQLYVEEHSAYDAWKLLSDGSLDGFFTPARTDGSVFQTLDLYRNPIMLGVSNGDGLAGKETVGISDILDLPLAFFSAPVPIEGILRASFGALGKEPHVVLRTSDQMLLRELTLRGAVYPILPLDMMATWEGMRQIPVDFFPPSVNRLVWSRALAPSPAMSAFLGFMGAEKR